ncbi:MAG: AraC family transcriptional regulator [Clostridia bacterium]|nr:AraC family transcriptional regulator [Clostridia bacterium]
MAIEGLSPPVYEDRDFPIVVEQRYYREVPDGWHEDLEIKISRSDRILIALDSQILTAQNNTIFFINPYQIHSVPNITGMDMNYDLIMINLDFFSVTGVHSISLRKIFMEDHIRFNNHLKNPRLTEILDKVIAVYGERKDPRVRLMIQGLLMEFFSILLIEEVSGEKTEIVQDGSRYYHTIAPALEAIHRNYDRKITSAELADMCKLTQSYFCRLFRQVMGVTPVQYQTENRLRLADILLKDGSYSIGDIARMTGFEDETYFSRCYKKYRGISPSKFQK